MVLISKLASYTNYYSVMFVFRTEYNIPVA